MRVSRAIPRQTGITITSHSQSGDTSDVSAQRVFAAKYRLLTAAMREAAPSARRV
jgi:hypothetical protein